MTNRITTPTRWPADAFARRDVARRILDFYALMSVSHRLDCRDLVLRARAVDVLGRGV